MVTTQLLPILLLVLSVYKTRNPMSLKKPKRPMLTTLWLQWSMLVSVRNILVWVLLMIFSFLFSDLLSLWLFLTSFKNNVKWLLSSFRRSTYTNTHTQRKTQHWILFCFTQTGISTWICKYTYMCVWECVMISLLWYRVNVALMKCFPSQK